MNKLILTKHSGGTLKYQVKCGALYVDIFNDNTCKVWGGDNAKISAQDLKRLADGVFNLVTWKIDNDKK